MPLTENTSLTHLNQRQSVVIDTMRFPLIVLVLYMHIVPIEPFPIDFSGGLPFPFYNLLAELVAHNIGRLAVPCFFLFSGYFYFRKMEKWSGVFYVGQQKKRWRTLLLPYLLWNLLNIAAILAKGYLMNLFGMDGSGDIGYIRGTSFWELMISPVNAPLWFLRDLICMTFLAPLFYYLFRYTRVFGLILLYAFYLTTLELPVRGFSMTAIFFFGIGAYCGTFKENLLYYCGKIKIPAYLLAALFVIIATLRSTSVYHEMWIRLFVPFGIISAVNLFHLLIDNTPVKNFCLRYSGTVFFVYALHEIYLKNWTKGAFYRTPLCHSEWGMIAGYLLMPLLLLALCLLIYYLLKRLFPKLLPLLTGGRI